MSRKGKEYKAYLGAAQSGEEVNRLPPKSTLRRWRLQGKLNEERLKQLGVVLGKRGNRAKPNQQAEPLSNALEPSASNSLSNSEPKDNAEDSSYVHIQTAISSSPNVSNVEENVVISGSDAEDNGQFSDLESHSSSFNLSDTNLSENEVDEDAVLSSISKSNFIGTDALNKPLHPSLSISKFETLLMILHLSMRHKMTDAFLVDLLNFVNLIVGNPKAIPSSKYLFHKLFVFGSKPTAHFYCPNCMVYIGPEDSCSSGQVECENEHCEWSSTVSSNNDGNYFLTLNLRKQIQNVLSKPGLKFVEHQRPDTNIISDIMDGTDYKSAQENDQFLSESNALTLTFNTDGAPVFKSGPNSLWPIHFLINEIDPSQRFNADHVLLGGLWFGKCEANVQIFLKPFVDELKELQHEGVIWKKPDGTVVESPVYAICCCTDSVAKPKVQCHLQFNGSFGCGYCLHPNNPITYLEKVSAPSGIVVRGQTSNNSVSENGGASEAFRTKKALRYTRGQYPLRTDRELRDHMKLAPHSLSGNVMGATGISALCELKYFDVVFGFVIDYMHAVLLGTVRRLVSYWLDSTNKGNPYYIAQAIDRIDIRVKSITLPSGMRPPRPLSDRVHWKANEWRSFLLYYGLAVLSGILPTPYHDHFKKLVIAVYTLSKASMTHDEVDSAHNLLQDFVWEYEELYGQVNMVYNVHLTGHLAQVVARKGPLWSYSAFPFESANGRLVNLAMGTKGVASQISRKYIMTKGVTTLLRNNYHASNNIVNFCCNLIGYNYLKNVMKGQNNETMLGVQFYYSLSGAQKQAFRDKDIRTPDSVLCVKRIVFSGKIYHSRLTTKQKKACDSCVRLKSGEYALIDLIFCDPRCDHKGNILFLVTKLNIACDPSDVFVPHFKQCSLDSFGDMDIFSSADIASKCIFYSCNKKNFVVEFANFYETD